MGRNKQVKSIVAKIQSPNLIFRPKHPQQLEALHCCEDNAITFLTGPAGCAKTFVATWYAIASAVQRRFDKIYVSRPAVTSGAEIGFTPGGVEEKMKHFLQPVYGARDKIGSQGLDQIKTFFEVVPLCYIRGRTIENAIMIVDEAQNLTADEVFTLVTRVGEGGKILICGDTDQNDLYDGFSVLELAAATYEGARVHGRSVGWYQFTADAIVRDPLTRELVSRTMSADWYKNRHRSRRQTGR